MEIYTCTMNLAIDLVIRTERMLEGVVNRTLSDDIQANGKGVNVSLVLDKLGQKSTALGFSAGFTGKYIQDELEKVGIATNFVDVPGKTRINVFTKVDETNEEFKLVNKGPFVHENEQKKLLNTISELKTGDYLVVSGSLPTNVPSQILVDISKICFDKNINLILDVSDPILLDCLQYNPFLIKPNDEELALLFDENMDSQSNIVEKMKLLREMGAQHIVVSLGGDGALYLDLDNNIYKSNSPKIDVVSTTCAGDTLLATFLHGLIKGLSTEKNLSRSVAAGSSTAKQVGLTQFDDIETLQKEIIIQKLEV